MVGAIVVSTLIIGGIVAGIVYYFTVGSGKMTRAIRLFSQKNYKDAEPLFLNIVTGNAENFGAKWYLAQIYEMKRNYDKAIKLYEEIIRRKAFDQSFSKLDVHRRLAEIYLKRDDVENAEREITTMIQFRPGEPIGYLKLGELAMARNNYKKAIESFTEALKVDPTNTETLRTLADCYYDMDSRQDAIKTYKQYIGLNKITDYEAHFRLGKCYRETMKLNDAIKQYEIASKSPKLRSDSYLAMGFLHNMTGNASTALVAFDEAFAGEITDQKEKLEALYTVAGIKAKAGKLQEAYTYWEKIYNVDPQYRDVESKISTFRNIKQSKDVVNLLSLPLDNFSKTMKKVLEKMGYSVTKEMQPTKDGRCRYIVTYKDRNKVNEAIVETARWTNPVGELIVQELMEIVKENRVYKGVYVTPSVFTDGAKKKSEIYPLELVDNEQLEKYLKKVKV